ncbi:MAG: carboxypeptidase-like regulatory domain-containing protein, partial [Bacteroidota bacterium]
MKLFLSIFAIAVSLSLQAQRNTISGYIREAGSGESLIGANVYVQEDPTKGATTNVYGFYSLSLPPGEYTMVYSYLGFADEVRTLDLTVDQTLDISLSEGATLTEVVVTSQEDEQNVEETQMGAVEISTEQIRKLP